MVMRIMAATSLVTLLTFAIWAQRGQAPAGAPAAPAITASEVAAMIAKSPSEKNALGQRMLQLGTYNVNMEHRVMGQAAAVHEKEAELFYVIEGAGTIVTGGKLTAPNRTNADNLTGSGIDGGVAQHVTKGDFVMVPENTPHWFS